MELVCEVPLRLLNWKRRALVSFSGRQGVRGTAVLLPGGAEVGTSWDAEGLT